MVPADADDIATQYATLLSELEQYNPQLLARQRVLAITKSDLIDDELQQLLSPTLPIDVPTIFISAATGAGLTQLTDLLWQLLSSEANQLKVAELESQVVHAPKSDIALCDDDDDIFEDDDIEVLELSDEDLQDDDDEGY